jgi:uncharacterized protein YdaL
MRIAKRKLASGPLVLAAALGLLFTLTVPAQAHHRPGHGGGTQPSPSPSPTPSPTPTCPVPGTAGTLIVYDNSGTWGHLGELYAIQSANLVGHFGTSKAITTSSYTAGLMNGYQLVIYIGSTYGEAIPTAFFDDVIAGTVPVIWMQHNIHGLSAYDPGFGARYGWTPGYYDTGSVDTVTYKGRSFTRRVEGQGGLGTYNIIDPNMVTTVATAVRTDGLSFPWAVRSGNLTYIGELPFPYATENDRWIVFADMLFDYLAPNTPERHRALVRLEDVGPDADPVILRKIADYLYSRNVPFSVSVYDTYVDPHGTYNNGIPESWSLKETPEVVSALKYMVSKGGTLLMHGHTHQYGDAINPYDGVSGNDFEFFMAHVDAEDYVRFDGPVPTDSVSWMTDRINQGLRVWKAVKLPTPSIFEFPHYAGSDLDYRVVANMFQARYERSLYFKGSLSGGTINHNRFVGEPADASVLSGQIFPYVVRDIYGQTVLPENLGNYEPNSYNHHPTRFPAEIIATAERNLAVRDGFASFFYHPYLGEAGLPALMETVEGIQALGYTFVSSSSLI